jgi:hypothetical protein
MNLLNYAWPESILYEIYWIRDNFADTLKPFNILVGTKGHVEKGFFVPQDNRNCKVKTNAGVIKIKVTEEDNNMGKRVGNYTNPQTGEEDWLEPDSVGMIVLQSKIITKVGEVNQSSIDFKLSASADENNILLTAEYSTNGQKYISKPAETPSETFADVLKDYIYADKTLDDSQLIKDMKDKACQDLSQRLMDNNILIGGMQFAGIGFVTADGDKMLTIESIDFDYTVQNNSGVRTAKLNNCVGTASLTNLENPQVVLYTGSYKIELIGIEVKQAEEGRLKDYVLSIQDIKITSDSSMPEHKVYESMNLNNEDFVDSFIEERKKLLPSVNNEDDDFDDRFGGLF